MDILYVHPQLRGGPTGRMGNPLAHPHLVAGGGGAVLPVPTILYAVLLQGEASVPPRRSDLKRTAVEGVLLCVSPPWWPSFLCTYAMQGGRAASWSVGCLRNKKREMPESFAHAHKGSLWAACTPPCSGGRTNGTLQSYGTRTPRCRLLWLQLASSGV